jgi:hypothetical protein
MQMFTVHGLSTDNVNFQAYLQQNIAEVKNIIVACRVCFSVSQHVTI